MPTTDPETVNTKGSSMHVIYGNASQVAKSAVADSMLFLNNMVADFLGDADSLTKESSNSLLDTMSRVLKSAKAGGGSMSQSAASDSIRETAAFKNGVTI